MKKTFLFLIAFALFSSCLAQKNKDSNSVGSDTVNISPDGGNIYKYARKDLARILKKDPELNDEVPNPPDVCWGESLKVSEDYNCEACRDDFYSLYAYFLMKKNGEAKYRQQRKTLIQLYRDINELFGRVNGGGTYYGHQYIRILAYAEWSVSVYDEMVTYNDIKSYDMTNQKTLYIKSLKQYVSDELNNNPELPPAEKLKKIRESFGKIHAIARLLTTNFYLSMTREFQYSEY